MGAIIADEAKTAQFLATQGLTLSYEAQALFLDCVLDEFERAILLLERRKVSGNPFAFKTPPVTRQRRAIKRENKAFNADEIRAILNAASALGSNLKTEFDAARRWVPWICAYTGSRPGEIAQLRGKDVVQHEGAWVIRISPEAGSVKTRKTRMVPSHKHIVEQGFIEFVKPKGDGPLFYSTKSPSKAATTDPTKPARPRSVTTRSRLAEWVRKDCGVTDPEVSPNHLWRHTFKRRAARARIEQRIRDAMCGHAPKVVGDEYETPDITDLVEAMKQFPRYEIAPTKDA